MDRDRLTITLARDILAKVDRVIDGTTIRNRSHAIEFLITKSLTPNVRQAVILAGGKGLNMRPFTFEMPKGLFPVGGKPILEHLLMLLQGYGVTDIIFSIGHLGEKIRDHFEGGKKFGVKITYVSEEKESGTGGALLLACKYITSDTFLAVHGDILINSNLTDLIAFHKEKEGIATIALSSVVDPSSYGEVVLHGSKITQFREKPQKGTQLSQMVSCGLYVFEKEIFKYIPSHAPSQLEEIFPRLAQKGLLYGFPFEGGWIDVGTPSSYEKAIREWGTNVA